MKPSACVHRNGAQLSPKASVPATAVAAGLMAWIATIVASSGGGKAVAPPSAAQRARTVRPPSVAVPIEALPSAASSRAALGVPNASIGAGDPSTQRAAASCSGLGPASPTTTVPLRLTSNASDHTALRARRRKASLSPCFVGVAIQRAAFDGELTLSNTVPTAIEPSSETAAAPPLQLPSG